MRMKITTNDAYLFVDESRLRDPDAFVLFELFYFDHGECVFELADQVRRDMPGGAWSTDRFYSALSRLVKKGFMVAVKETIQ